MAHYLKTVQPYFERVFDCSKRFEVRWNDRDFEEGDEIYLQEYDVETKLYSGREVRGKITYVLKDYEHIEYGFVVFGF
jgi:hypothetical protein